MRSPKELLLTVALALAGFAGAGELAAQSLSVEMFEAFPKISLEEPTDLQSDGQGMLYALERPGRMVRFRNDPQAGGPELFLDLQKKVNSGGLEEGLLGLAFHPKFADNKQFFVYYTASNPPRKVIARYRADIPGAESGEVLLEIPQPYSNHNGGALAFGPDGYLYIGVGDGGSAGDPKRFAQNNASLLGKILRIDVDRSGDGKLYSIPGDNPFAGEKGKLGEIFAYGLRNPWRISFDRPSSRLWAADVGQNQLEEIDVITKGGNYGWNIMEGTRCFRPSSGCDKRDLIAPVHVYDRGFGVSITGGYVYRGARVPALRGRYVYADFESGRIWALRYDRGYPVESVEIFRGDFNISSFGVDEKQELYALDFRGRILGFRPGS